jgi:hypothetical protein
MLALAVVGAMWLPAVGQENCTDPDKLSLIYIPGELPPCPPRAPRMEDLIPSTVGRPPDYTALALARCAGLFDAELLAFPEASTYPEFVDGDRYFDVAKSRRERPSLKELEDRRREGLDYWLPLLPEQRGSGMFIHAAIFCGDLYAQAYGQ